MRREDIKILVKKWWEIYEDESLDYKNDMADEQGNLEALMCTLPDNHVLQQERVRAPLAA